MRALITAAFSIFLSVTAASAQSHADEVQKSDTAPAWPSEFRGVQFGASLAQAETVLGPMKCSGVPGLEDAKRCWTTDRTKAFRIDGEAVNTYYLFYRDRFLKVDLSQDEPFTYRGAAFKNLVGPLFPAFKQKFGEPTVTSNEQRTTWTWSSDNMRATIEAVTKQFGSGSSEQFLNSASISMKEWDDSVSAAMAKKVRF